MSLEPLVKYLNTDAAVRTPSRVTVVAERIYRTQTVLLLDIAVSIFRIAEGELFSQTGINLSVAPEAVRPLMYLSLRKTLTGRHGALNQT